MGYWEGLLGGFQGRKAEVEKRNYEEGLAAQQRETAVFSSLMQSDDPEVRSLALTGLLDTANPRRKKGGLRGWIGETQASPYMSQIQQLLQTPVTEQKQIQLPGQAEGLAGPIPGMPAVTPTITQTPGATPAAAPTTSMVDTPITAAPPKPQVYAQQPPIPYSVQRPRQAFLPPDERLFRNEMAQVQAEVEGDKMRVAAGLAPRYGVRGNSVSIAGQTYMEGNITPDATSPTGFSQEYNLRSDPSVVIRRPAMDPRLGKGGQTNEVALAAAQLFPDPVLSPQETLLKVANDPGKLQQIYAQVAKTKAIEASQVAGARTTAQALAEAAAPLSRMDTLQATQSLRDDWFKVSAPQEALKRQLGTLNAAQGAIARGDTAAGSEAIIVTFEKMLDSLSVVRESEYLRPAFNQSLYDRVQGYIDTLKNGGARMTPEVLQTYVRLAREIGTAAQQDYNQHRMAIERTARTAGLDPANIFGTIQPSATAPPAPGGAAGTPVSAPTGGPPVPGTGGLSIGDPVLHNGKRYRVTGITNGQAELEEIQ